MGSVSTILQLVVLNQENSLTYIQPFKPERQYIQHWIAVRGHKHGLGTVFLYSFLSAVENVIFGWKTKISRDSCVSRVPEALGRGHELGYPIRVFTSIFLAKIKYHIINKERFSI